MKIDNRFDQGEPEAGTNGAARWIGAIKAIENARKMFRRNSRAVISHRNFGAALQGAYRNPDFSVFRREPERIVDQISDRAIKQDRISEDFGVAIATDFDVSILGQGFIEADNFFHGGSGVE